MYYKTIAMAMALAAGCVSLGWALGRSREKGKILMKLSEIKAQVAEAAARSAEAFAELGKKVADLQKQIDDLIAGAGDPDVADETFLADLNTLKSNVNQLADIVPNPTDPPPSTGSDTP